MEGYPGVGKCLRPGSPAAPAMSRHEGGNDVESFEHHQKRLLTKADLIAIGGVGVGIVIVTAVLLLLLF